MLQTGEEQVKKIKLEEKTKILQGGDEMRGWQNGMMRGLHLFDLLQKWSRDLVSQPWSKVNSTELFNFISRQSFQLNQVKTFFPTNIKKYIL